MKKNFYNELLSEKKYLELCKLKANNEMLQVIEFLKQEYLDIVFRFTLTENKILLNNSERSEIFGKFMMLAHEHGGLELVNKLMSEIQIKFQELDLRNLSNEY